MPPDFLVIGHVSKDLQASGYRLGGTVTYAAATAQRLGLRAAVLTRAAKDLDLAQALPGVDVLQLESAHTTTFENRYDASGRQQIIHARADALQESDLPTSWHAAPIVLLGPLAQEMEPEMVGCFDGLVGVTPQGWMREWDDEGRVSRCAWQSADQVLGAVDVLVLSDEDVGGDMDVVQSYAAVCPIVALTLGQRGAHIYWKDEIHAVLPRPAREVDPTGAGDVFAAAFLIRLSESADPLEAGAFANVAASFSVEQVGIAAIPSRGRVEAWLERRRGG